MAEIKSTLELVMQKTQHLKLNTDEKKQHAADRIKKTANGLLQQYVDQRMDAVTIKERLESFDASSADMAQKALFGLTLSQLQIDQDQPLHFKLLETLFELNCDPLKKIYTEFQAVLAKKLQEKSNDWSRYWATEHNISGTALVPNLNNEDDWLTTTTELKKQYTLKLEKEMQNLRQTQEKFQL